MVEFRHEAAFFDLAQNRAVDELFRFGRLGARIVLRHPGELGLDRRGRRMGNLGIEFFVEPVDFFQGFAVVYLQILTQRPDRRLRDSF